MNLKRLKGTKNENPRALFLIKLNVFDSQVSKIAESMLTQHSDNWNQFL